jgi:hypothetical protein
MPQDRGMREYEQTSAMSEYKGTHANQNKKATGSILKSGPQKLGNSRKGEKN